MHEKGLHVRLRQTAPIPLDVEFSCGKEELLALVGPSGSGKTTILRSIAGLYQPHEGLITCGGTIWFDPASGINVSTHKRAVGFVFQEYALFPHMKVLRNVMTAIGPGSYDDRRSRALALLALINLQGLEDRLPSSLSGGQQQRVAMARALARDPAVLLLDEPFSAVDRRTRRKLRDELADLRKIMRIPIVLVTHDLDEAVALSDRMCVIDKGETLQTGKPHDLVRAPSNKRVAEALDLTV